MSVGPLAVHPLVACADAIEAALKDVAGVDPTFMRTGEKAEVLRRLDRLESRLSGLRMRVMAHADEVGGGDRRPHCGDLAGRRDPYRSQGAGR